jgi:hypothetical protein
VKQVNLFLEPVRALLLQIGTFLPKFVLALVIALIGWGLAKLIRLVVRRALRAANLHVVAQRAGVDGFLERGGVRTDTIGILAGLVYWLMIFIALLVAFNSLDLAYASDLLGRLILFLPRVIVAILIIAFGTYFAGFVGQSVTAYGRGAELRQPELLGRIARSILLVFVALIALDEMQIGGDIIRLTFLILLAGVVLALALAFGLGGQQWAARWLEHWRAPDADR